MNGTAVAVREQPMAVTGVVFSVDQIELIKRTICKGATDDELEFFLGQARRTGLDPFARQIYAVFRWDSKQRREVMQTQVSIDGFRLIAERTGHYGGQIGPQWCGRDGVWRDVWLEDDFPAAARVGVLRTDWREPLYAVASWKSYVQTYKKDNQEHVGAMWQRMSDVMIAKCAESQALRRAFPHELSGLYTAEEMAQADRQPPPIEDLPQFQDAIARATVVQAASAPVPQEGPTPPPVTNSPADAETRAKFEANWAKGVARAVACGVTPDGKPRPDATSGALNRAQKALLADIVARETLNAEMIARIKEVKAAGGDVADVDPATCTSVEIHEMLATLADMLAATPDDDSEAF
jgi:phage recombination protein Bet